MRDPEPGRHRLAAVVLIAFAALLAWNALTRDARLTSPPWLTLLCALALAVAAARVLQLRGRPHSAGHGFAVILLAAFAVVGGWIALGPGARVCSVGAADVPLGEIGGWRCRLPFGIGAAITAAMATYALRLWLRSRRSDQVEHDAPESPTGLTPRHRSEDY